ncbi:MAG TPA: gliding motility-associated C-terminal domain-containing protein [Saprospiraceae bacterium]|nr:gliding motility-associated C-terminal domain-containing protein [Saprospiraceae bacterium]
MHHPKSITQYLLITLFITLSGMSVARSRGYGPPPPPANDNCTNAMAITISGNGFDYSNFTSQVSDLTMATGQTGEFFEFATDYSHKKSVWFQFTLVTARSIKIKLETAPGSTLPDPKQSGVTLYAPSNCLPGAIYRLGSIISSGELERYCTTPGTYRIQVTAVDNVNASFLVNLTLSCPFDPIYPEDSQYDCPDKAHLFNSGSPLPQSSSSYTGVHAIECHSIEDPSEYACLPVANKTQYLKSSWYVFTTGSMVDFLAFDFTTAMQSDVVGYRLLEGNVHNDLFSSLPLIECGLAQESSTTRYIEFPCTLKPSTTYSLELIFHKDYVFNTMNMRALQRGVTATGWPKPVLPPVLASNQLGTLPLSSTWDDRFDCSSFISKNSCPPANPFSGIVVAGTGPTPQTFDLSTWATFSLATDVNIKFLFSFTHSMGRYHTRIFSRTLNNGCPSPDPFSGDLYYEFSGKNGEVKCLPAGDYSIQVLASSHDNFGSSNFYKDSWSNGYLGTRFTLRFTIVELPAVGLFRLDATNEFDSIHNLDPLQNGVFYPSTPAVFICSNTVLPENVKCLNLDKTIYREVNIGDADANGVPDEGLLCIQGLRTDPYPNPPVYYQFLMGDANQLATAAGTHAEGQVIPGLTDHVGFCIDRDDITFTPPGIDVFCTCVTSGIYTLASFGGVDNVGRGDAPVFQLNTLKTIHDSRPNAELITLGPIPGNYASGVDVFSCTDNLGNMPPCGDRRKLIYREFYLPDTAVMTITEIGSAFSLLSLFSGRASDLADNLTLISDCFSSAIFIDYCTAFEPGWYTVVSYGEGPNYTDTKVWNLLGDQRDVGKTSRIGITLMPVVIPNYNRPDIAYQAGITDWATPPANDPNFTTGQIYYFEPDTFCAPDTPFIPDFLRPCTPIYNRISFYVFEITKPSFVQIRNINQSFFTEVYPFDVNAQPGDLLTVPPVYQCVSSGYDYRQICDLPPGKYTIAIFANDSHMGQMISPAIYVDEAALSRFDHAWNAYDFDLIPTTNAFVNGKPFDTHPFLTGQAPSRDVFYCTTGANIKDPTDTKCYTQFNSLIYGQASGVPKPLFLDDNPLQPWAQPWRNVWYTFMLNGSGTCTIHSDALSGPSAKPLMAVYESDADGNIPWTTLQTLLNNPNDTIIPGLKLIKEHVNDTCNSNGGDIAFAKSGCIRDNVRYYVVASFDAHEYFGPPNLPNQAMSLSIKYNGKPTFAAPYDEVSTANVVNGLLETTPPYTSVPLIPGNAFIGVDFSLLCYTKNASDPPGCSSLGTGKSAWFKFDVASPGQIYVALEKIGVPNGWLASTQNMTIWRDNGTGAPLTNELSLSHENALEHAYLKGCIDPGTYYLLVRHCSFQIDTIQPYRVLLKLVDSPGDFCSNAIPVDVVNFSPASGSAIVNCHSIGTDIGETPPVGNSCFPIASRKTSWFHVVVSAGPMVDLKFQLGENFTTSTVDLSDVSYRILAGTCGAMTPIACSEGNINLTLNCLGTGDYYVQVSMPEKDGTNINSPEVEGTLSLTVTATPSNPVTCTEPVDPNEINAEYTYISDCQTITFFNLSTAGTDITYLWVFPNGTSTDPNPIWTPPSGTSTYTIMLTVTNTALNTSISVSKSVSVNAPFDAYAPMPDSYICNGTGSVLLDASFPGATYLWDNNSTGNQRLTGVPGTFWVKISLDGCEKLDTVVVEAINAKRTINPTLCPESGITINNQVFNKNNPTGIITIPNADPSGCDSILTVNLSFYAAATHQFSQTICTGETFIFDNQDLAQTGTYHDTLTSSRGCDSIVTLNLNVTPREILEHAVSGCTGAPLLLTPVTVGANYEWDNGDMTNSLIVNSPGSYAVSVTDLANCIIGEETFIVTFGVLASPNVSIPNPDCVGLDVLLTASGSSGEYQWFDAATGGNLLGTGSTLLLSDLQSDINIYVQAYQVGFDTCKSPRAVAQVQVIEEDVQYIEMDTIICPGSFVTLPWGENVKPDTNSSYTNTWQHSVTGCDSLELTVHVTLLDVLSLSLPPLLTIHLGDTILLEPQISFLPDSLIWLPFDGLSCANCLRPLAFPLQSTDYELSIWSIDGCLISAPLRIEVERDVHIYIPNVFSPNDDGINDIFSVFANREIREVRKLSVFDRWGDGVWEGKNFPANGTIGWDGFSHGKRMLSGVYVWVCEIELIDGSVERLKGDVTLVR